jgi:hypothetical protein
VYVVVRSPVYHFSGSNISGQVSRVVPLKKTILFRYGDAVGAYDGTHPHVLSFSLSWFQKMEKTPDPAFDDEPVDEPEVDILNIPISSLLPR